MSRLVLLALALTLAAAQTQASYSLANDSDAQLGWQPSIFRADQDTPFTTSDNATWASHALRKAIKGRGTDEQMLIDVLGPMAPQERYRVATRYHELYGDKLKSDLESDTSGCFADLLGMLVVPLPELEHDIIWTAHSSYNHKARAFTKANLVVPLLAARGDDDMKQLKETYYSLEGNPMIKHVKPMLSDDALQVLMPRIDGEHNVFDPAVHTMDRAARDASKLYDAGVGRWWGTDEETFIKLIVGSPREHLCNISTIYQQKHKHSIARAVEKEFSGDVKDALLLYVNLQLESTADALAALFESTMAGMGTDEDMLSGSLVRYYHFLPEICEAYARKYDGTLRDRIIGNTSGDYQTLLLRVLDAAVPFEATPIRPTDYRWLYIVLLLLLALVMLGAVVGALFWLTNKLKQCCTRRREPNESPRTAKGVAITKQQNSSDEGSAKQQHGNDSDGTSVVTTNAISLEPPGLPESHSTSTSVAWVSIDSTCQ